MYFRSKRIIHRDFKLSNFLIGAQMEVKVSDFGLACQLETVAERRLSVCGTPAYMAPE
jgi:serine/threonine protein kinase